MEQLNLKITIPYHNICAMDSREVKFVGIVLGFLVQLAKYLDIHLKMDILVIDVHEKWGMFLSTKWAANLGGSIQMDWTYGTITLSEYTMVKLHGEK